MSRRLPSDQRRAQLLECALDIAERGGINSVTIRGVAERADVSLGVVHYCYRDKDELLGEVINAVNAELATAAEGFVSIDFGSGQTGPEALRRRLYDAIDLIWAVVSASPNRQLLTYEIVTYAVRDPNPDVRRLAAGQYDGYDRIVRTTVEGTAAATGMRWTKPVEEIVRIAMSAIDGVALRWILDRDDDVAIVALHGLIDLLTIAAEPAEPGSAAEAPE